MINTVPKNAWNKVGLISSFQLPTVYPVIVSKKNIMLWKIQQKELHFAFIASSLKTSENLQSATIVSANSIAPKNYPIKKIVIDCGPPLWENLCKRI